MIYLTKGQTLYDNLGLVVYDQSGYYNDGDTVICAPAYSPEEPAVRYEVKYVAYGGMVYNTADQDKLMTAILAIDPNSLFGKNSQDIAVDKMVQSIVPNEPGQDNTNATPELDVPGADQATTTPDMAVPDTSVSTTTPETTLPIQDNVSTTTPEAIIPDTQTSTTTPDTIAPIQDQVSTTTPEAIIPDTQTSTTTPDIATTTDTILEPDSGLTQ